MLFSDSVAPNTKCLRIFLETSAKKYPAADPAVRGRCRQSHHGDELEVPDTPEPALALVSQIGS